MAAAPSWICLMVSSKFHHGDSNALKDGLKLIFGNDLKDFRVVFDDTILKSGEYYVFIQCENYHTHIEMITKTPMITGVVPSIHTPHLFPESEITKFYKSTHKASPTLELGRGDVVLVKEGYLKGLCGLIVKKPVGNKIRVLFRFHIRKFYEMLKISSLEQVGNLNSHLNIRNKKRVGRKIRGAKKS